jgi:hypothetical protein
MGSPCGLVELIRRSASAAVGGWSTAPPSGGCASHRLLDLEVMDVQAVHLQLLDPEVADDGPADGQPADRHGADGARPKGRGSDRDRSKASSWELDRSTGARGAHGAPGPRCRGGAHETFDGVIPGDGQGRALDRPEHEPAARGPARPPASRCHWSGADRAAAGPPRWAVADVGDRAALRRVGWSGEALVGLEWSAGTSMGPPYQRCQASGTTTLFAELWLGKAHHALAIRRSVVAADGLGSKLCLPMKIDGRPPVILTTVVADVSPPP